MRILFSAAAAFLLLTGAALAQASAIIDADTVPANKAIDQNYRDVLKRMPDPKEPHDPWGTVREDKPTDAKAKSASGKKTAN